MAAPAWELAHRVMFRGLLDGDKDASAAEIRQASAIVRANIPVTHRNFNISPDGVEAPAASLVPADDRPARGLIDRDVELFKAHRLGQDLGGCAVRGFGKPGGADLHRIGAHADFGGQAVDIGACGQSGADDGGFDIAPALAGGIAAAPVAAACGAAAVAHAGAHAALAGESLGHGAVGFAVAESTAAGVAGGRAVGDIIAGHGAVLIGDKDLEFDLGDLVRLALLRVGELLLGVVADRGDLNPAALGKFMGAGKVGIEVVGAANRLVVDLVVHRDNLGVQPAGAQRDIGGIPALSHGAHPFEAVADILADQDVELGGGDDLTGAILPVGDHAAETVGSAEVIEGIVDAVIASCAAGLTYLISVGLIEDAGQPGGAAGDFERGVPGGQGRHPAGAGARAGEAECVVQLDGDGLAGDGLAVAIERARSDRIVALAVERMRVAEVVFPVGSRADGAPADEILDLLDVGGGVDGQVKGAAGVGGRVARALEVDIGRGCAQPEGIARDVGRHAHPLLAVGGGPDLGAIAGVAPGQAAELILHNRDARAGLDGAGQSKHDHFTPGDDRGVGLATRAGIVIGGSERTVSTGHFAGFAFDRGGVYRTGA